MLQNIALWTKSETFGYAEGGSYLNPKHEITHEVSVRINPKRFDRLTALSNVEPFHISIFGLRIYHTLNVHNINFYRVESVPCLLGQGIYLVFM
jgi:hypothetical protein